MNKRYTAKKNFLFCDFETNQKDDEKMVYAWMIKDMTNSKTNSKYKSEGVSISSFLSNLWLLPFKTKRVMKMLFHNGSGFDFHFIISALAKDKRFKQRDFVDNKKLLSYIRQSDYKRVNTVRRREKASNGQYELLVDGTSKIYQIIIHLEIDGKMRVLYLCCAWLTFSYPLSILGDVLGKCGYELKKGDIDHKNRYYASVSELKADKKVYEYLERDVDILKTFWLEYTKYISYQHQEITAASTAWWDWLLRSKDDLELIHKEVFGDVWTSFYMKQKKGGSIKLYSWKGVKKMLSPKAHMRRLISELLPSLSYDDDEYMRKWYSGGLTTLNWAKIGLIHSEVNYYDINSAYPNAMMSEKYPIGKPYRGRKKGYDFELLKLELTSDCVVYDNNLSFVFLKSKNGSKFYLRRLPKGQTIFLTSAELIQFKKTYKGTYNVSVKYSFRTVEGKKLFGAYINYWYNIKKKKENPILTLVAKLMLNSLYGKFGSKTLKESKILNPEKVHKWDNNQLSMTKWEHEVGMFESSFYLPIGIKITADVRMKIVTTVGDDYSKFIYADTDSIAFSNNHQIATGKELGEWKLEAGNMRMLVAGKKRYILENEHMKKIAFASYKLKPIKDKITFNSFIHGVKGIKHLHKKEVQHGVILNDGEKEIKPIWSEDYERSPDCWFKTKKEYLENNPLQDF